MRTSGSWAKSNERVLVIADSDEMRDILVDVLRPEGFVVFDQPSAIGATRSIRENAIRAVVVDAGAPAARGEKLVSLLRENPRLHGLILVVVTDEQGTRRATSDALDGADATIERKQVVRSLPSLLNKLLRSSNFRPREAFSAGLGKT
jgi:DNA-binding response OmpR family regulator